MKSIFWKMFLSYILILILPLLVMGMLCYWWTGNIVAKQVQQSYNVVIGEVKANIDNRFKELNTYCFQLSQTPWVKKIMYMQGSSIDYTRIDRLELYEHVDELRSYDAINEFIDKIVLVFPEKNEVISPAITEDLNSFFKEEYKLKNMDYSKLVDILKTYNLMPKILPPDILYVYGSRNEVVTYIQSVPSSDMKPRAVLVTYVNNEVIASILKNLDLPVTSAIYIVDEKENIITGINRNDNIQKALFKNNGKSNKAVNGVADIKGEKYFYFHSESDLNKWKYYFIIPFRTVLYKVYIIRTVTIILTLILFMSGFIVSYKLTVKNYDPLSRLVGLINGRPLPEKIAKFNEYNFLETSISSILSKENLLRRQTEQQKPLIKNIYLLKLLDNSSNAEEGFIERIKAVNIVFSHPAFLVVLFNLNSEKGMDDEVQRKISEKISGNMASIYFAEIDGKRKAAIINFSVDNIYRGMVISLKSVLEEKLETGSIAGVGSLHYSLKEIPDSFKEAQVAIDYRLINDKSDIIFFDGIEICNETYYYYPVDKEGQMLNELRIGKFDSAMNIIDSIIHINVKDNRLNLTAAKCLFYDLIGTAFKALNELPMNHSISIDQKRISALNTISDIRPYLAQIYGEICSLIQQKKKSHNEILKESIKLYIDENYAIQSLSLESVADAISVSPSYFGKFFKEQFGYNFLDYLHKKRIEMAKTLLNGQFTVAQVAQMAGYSNYETFRRVFKKYEGITPGELKIG